MTVTETHPVGAPEPFAEFEVITPDKAREYLAANHKNRNLAPGAIARWEGAMRRGEWMSDSTDAIGIAVDGGVVNGQHRLTAVTKADIPVKMLVVHNVSPDVVKVIDQGHGRTLAQWLSIQGNYDEPGTMAIAIEWVYRIIHGQEAKLPEAVKPTVPMLLDLLSLNEHLDNSIEPVAAAAKKMGLSKAILTAYHYAMASVDGIDPETVDEFFVRLADGYDGAEGSPVHILRDKYFENAKKAESQRVKGVQLYAWLVKAWQATVDGSTMTAAKLKWISKGSKSEPFPRVANVPWIDQVD
jgi:hypothetical protein